jgi:putative transposase
MIFFWARQVISAMRFHHDAGNVASLAWVLMPDHLHWLFELGDRLTLSELVGSMKSYSARRIRHALAGSSDDGGNKIWQPGFHDHALRREESMVAIARYIVANPLRAGIAAELGDYPFWDACWL